MWKQTLDAITALRIPGWIGDVAINIVASILIAVFLFAWHRRRARYPYDGLLRLLPGRQFYVVCAGIHPDEFEVKSAARSAGTDVVQNEDRFYGTGYGELVAMHNVTRVLATLGRDVTRAIVGIDLGCANYYDVRRLDGDLILIGGGTFNEVVRKMWPLVRDRLRYDIHDDLCDVPDGNFWIEDRLTPSRRQATSNPGRKPGSVDWGLITYVANPFNVDSTMLVIDGLHSYGLIGASKLLLVDCLRRYGKELKRVKGREFQILVQCLVEPPEVFVMKAWFEPYEVLKIRQQQH